MIMTIMMLPSIRWSMDATGAAGTAGTSLAPKCGAGATGSRGAAAGAAPRAVRSESIFLGNAEISEDFEM